MKKNLSVGNAVLWTMVLLLHSVNAFDGAEPTWFLVFIPVIVLVINYWVDVFYNAGDKND